MGLVQKLIFWVPALVVLVLLGLYFYATPGTGFVKLEKTVDKVEEFLPEVGADELEGGTVEIPEEHRSQILQLNETISRMMASSNKNCFANYGGFTDLGEKGTSISLSYDQVSDTTTINVGGGAGGKQMVTDLRQKIPGMRPCVIAGDYQVTKNFWNKFMEGRDVSGSYFKPVQQLKIYYAIENPNYQMSDWRCDDGNRITVPEFDKNTVNDHCDNFNEGGWIFTPDNKHICFIPTNLHTNYDRDGIEHDFHQRRSLPQC